MFPKQSKFNYKIYYCCTHTHDRHIFNGQKHNKSQQQILQQQQQQQLNTGGKHSLRSPGYRAQFIHAVNLWQFYLITKQKHQRRRRRKKLIEMQTIKI